MGGLMEKKMHAPLFTVKASATPHAHLDSPVVVNAAPREICFWALRRRTMKSQGITKNNIINEETSTAKSRNTSKPALVASCVHDTLRLCVPTRCVRAIVKNICLGTPSRVDSPTVINAAPPRQINVLVSPSTLCHEEPNNNEKKKHE